MSQQSNNPILRKRRLNQEQRLQKIVIYDSAKKYPPLSLNILSLIQKVTNFQLFQNDLSRMRKKVGVTRMVFKNIYINL